MPETTPIILAVIALALLCAGLVTGGLLAWIILYYRIVYRAGTDMVTLNADLLREYIRVYEKQQPKN